MHQNRETMPPITNHAGRRSSALFEANLLQHCLGRPLELIVFPEF